MKHCIFYGLISSIPTVVGLNQPNTNPFWIPADSSGMGSNVVELAKKMGRGWNIGNTMEAVGNDGETSWGNAKVTPELVRAVKNAGFQSIRIPCSWDQYVEDRATNKIKQNWLDRVKEVVQYCVDNGLYTVLNIHWDGGWLEGNCTTNMQQQVLEKQRAFWLQIAVQLREFDEHLLFASANEPNVTTVEEMKVLYSYHEAFINTVRSTGGRNTYRALVVQGPGTSVEKTNELMQYPPYDSTEGRLMVEIHYYTPYMFTIMDEDADWGKMSYFWGKNYQSSTNPIRTSTNDETLVDNDMKLLTDQFTSKGIPVLMGEYCVHKRLTLTGDDLNRHLESRKHWLNYVTHAALANGIVPMYWDNGFNGNLGSALFDRQSYSVTDPQALQSIMQ